MPKKLVGKQVKGLDRKRRTPTGVGKILSTRNLQEVETRFQVVTLRRDGYTQREIAESLGISEVTVNVHLTKALDMTLNETAVSTEQERQLQVERLDSLLKTYMPIARGHSYEVDDPAAPGGKRTVEVKPNLNVANSIVVWETRRAKLLALDKPEIKKLEVTGIREYIGVDLDSV